MNTHHILKNFQERNIVQALLEALHWGALRSRLDMRGDILGKPVEYKYRGKFNDSMPQTADLRVSPKAQMKRDFTEADQFLCLPATVNYFCPSQHNIFRGSPCPPYPLFAKWGRKTWAGQKSRAPKEKRMDLVMLFSPFPTHRIRRRTMIKYVLVTIYGLFIRESMIETIAKRWRFQNTLHFPSQPEAVGVDRANTQSFQRSPTPWLGHHGEPRAWPWLYVSHTGEPERLSFLGYVPKWFSCLLFSPERKRLIPLQKA